LALANEQVYVDRAAHEKEAKVKKGVGRSSEVDVSVPSCSVTALLEALVGADSKTGKGKEGAKEAGGDTNGCTSASYSFKRVELKSLSFMPVRARNGRSRCFS
jgi:hypothetical protein